MERERHVSLGYTKKNRPFFLSVFAELILRKGKTDLPPSLSSGGEIREPLNQRIANLALAKFAERGALDGNLHEDVHRVVGCSAWQRVCQVREGEALVDVDHGTEVDICSRRVLGVLWGGLGGGCQIERDDGFVRRLLAAIASASGLRVDLAVLWDGGGSGRWSIERKSNVALVHCGIAEENEEEERRLEKAPGGTESVSKLSDDPDPTPHD